MPASLEPARAAIRRRITELFNDASRGERPILRRADALFATDSVAWRVNGDIVTMMIGGVSGLLLQMLHPAVLAGVWDHSDFRSDMHGRLRRTAKFIAVTTYDHAEHGLAAIDRVRGIHDRIGGVLPDGTPYRVSDPALLAWVHVTEAISFLTAWIRYAEPGMSMADQDRYFAEMAVVAGRLGADPVPRDRASAETLIRSMRPALRADARTREVAQLVLNQSVGAALTDAASAVIMQAGVDLLPDWARAMQGLRTPPKPAVRAGARALAGALGWAYEGSPNHEVWPADVTVWPRD
ncbi:oxygenase MpaB family protein [Brevundimonas sp.]|uniref:oxygenase MpaB family protein n=1 Tax=Brevundimonas sp. TaxID=1871086 RepID=UPI00273795CB|nr:oxygenase MpaB family protein [Brevundimonas sp.]MDP3800840.1 oxygenase MpaB family protein [Brevundimonas sp.]